MFEPKQFYIFQSKNNFSSDQLDLIARTVKIRQKTLQRAVQNINQAVSYMESNSAADQPKPTSKTQKKLVKKEQPKKPNFPSKPANKNTTKALKGRVSYKVKGPGGQLMNIADIKKRLDTIYDGKQGIIKK